jgi:8-amino-7-oxononanoate synthase
VAKAVICWVKKSTPGCLELNLSNNLTRKLETLQNQGTTVEIQGQVYHHLASSDYLSLSRHPRVIQAAQTALTAHGLGSTGSRYVSGESVYYSQLEELLGQIYQSGKIRVFSSGYLANLAATTTFITRRDTVFSDKLNHASLVDALILSRAQVYRYPHLDYHHLEAKLKQQVPHNSSNNQTWIVSDGVFSMDGDACDVRKLVELKQRYGCKLLIDDAHGVGVLGKFGEGLCSDCLEHIDVLIGTFSKAYGGYGGYVVVRTEEDLHQLTQQARTGIYTTALPPSVLAGVREAVLIGTQERHRATQAIALAQTLATGLGLDVTPAGAIVPWVLGGIDETLQMQDQLKSWGYFAKAIRPPSVPVGQSRIRFCLQADLDPQVIHMLVTQLKTGITVV